MKNKLQYAINGLVSMIITAILMASPIAAIVYASDFIQKQGTYAANSRSNAQQNLFPDTLKLAILDIVSQK